MRFRGVNLQTTLRLCHIQMKYDKVEEEEKNASQKTVHRLNVTHTDSMCYGTKITPTKNIQMMNERAAFVLTMNESHSCYKPPEKMF